MPRKLVRTFTSGEAAGLLGVNESYPRKLRIEGRGPSPVLTSGNRRHYSVHDIQDPRVFARKNSAEAR